MNKSNNPFINDHTAEGYDESLRAPIVKSIRKEESEVMKQVFAQCLTQDTSVLEIGAGTGFYTIDIARMAASVTAIEPGAGMIAQLHTKLTEQLPKEKLETVSTIQTDLEHFQPQHTFDHVIAIGILDYISDPAAFIARCFQLCTKNVIITAPNRCLWTLFYRIGAKLQGLHIHAYSAQAFKHLFTEYTPNCDVSFYEAGLKTWITGGFTHIACIKKL